MPVLQSHLPCDQSSGKRDDACKIKSGFPPVGTIAVVSVAVGVFAILLCFRSTLKSKVDPYSIINNTAGRGSAARRTTMQSTPASKNGSSKFPKIEKPAQYYDRVLGKWVDDVNLADETIRDVIAVVYPDPGGMPNIPYNENTSTDVPMPQGSYPSQTSPAAQIMIPAHFATRRALVHYGRSAMPVYAIPMPVPVYNTNSSVQRSSIMASPLAMNSSPMTANPMTANPMNSNPMNSNPMITNQYWSNPGGMSQAQNQMAQNVFPSASVPFPYVPPPGRSKSQTYTTYSGLM